MTFLLDANIVAYFFEAKREAALAAAAVSARCAIVDAVERELLAAPGRAPRFSRWLPTSNLARLSIEVGSPADATLLALETGLTSRRGNGERASIALAANDSQLTFVAMDKNALWIALRELRGFGERVVGLQVFLGKLVDAGALDRTVAHEVLGISRHTVPTWWHDWLHE